ncbi:MAG: tetratricopeptide repeat protein [Marinifilaceae bacterium]|jgi:tetratricopeptide (TPR) repeat protein|nr:tetratricopeptide repeat protein [Marinifilaceae bacterium]
MFESYSDHSNNDMQFVVSRFEKMLKNEHLEYFDVHEFEQLVDYFSIDKNYPSALKACNIGFVQHPTASSLQLKKAELHINLNEYSDALNILNKLQFQDSYNKDVFLLKACAHNMIEEYEEAEKNFDRALKLDITNSDPDLAFRIGNGFMQYSQYEIALKYLKQVKDKKENSDVYFELAYCYEKLDLNTESIENYKFFIDFNPFSENAWYNLGVVYSKTEEHAKAIDAYDYALAINPEHEKAYFNKGNSLYNNEQFEEALKSYNEHLAIEDDHSITYTYIAECFEELDELDLAISNYEEALKIDEENPNTWYNIGIIHHNEKRFDEAIIYFEKAFELNPDDNELILALFSSYKNTDRKHKALEILNIGNQKYPEDSDICLELAECYFDFEQYESATNIIIKCINLNPNKYRLYATLVGIYLTTKDYDLAKLFTEKAYDVDHNFLGKLKKQYPVLSEHI